MSGMDWVFVHFIHWRRWSRSVVPKIRSNAPGIVGTRQREVCCWRVPGNRAGSAAKRWEFGVETEWGRNEAEHHWSKWILGLWKTAESSYGLSATCSLDHIHEEGATERWQPSLASCTARSLPCMVFLCLPSFSAVLAIISSQMCLPWLPSWSHPDLSCWRAAAQECKKWEQTPLSVCISRIMSSVTYLCVF